MGIKTSGLPRMTGFGSSDELIAHGPTGPGLITGEEAAKFFDRFFPYILYNYDGVNIKEKFAGEMDYTEPWVWLNQRLAAQDVSGLHIKDYFEVTAGGNLLQMQMAGINHDLHFADEEIKKYHIDFISKDLWPERHVWNKVAYNNGLSSEGAPWLVSDLKAWLNSEKAEVPNGTEADPDTAAVDYSTTGVFDKLPASLQNVIVERRSREPVRYTAGELLTDDNSGKWADTGRLWVPHEIEVYGQSSSGSRRNGTNGAAHQYPIFLDGKTRVKKLGGARTGWWLRLAASGNSRYVALVVKDGYAGSYTAANEDVGAPVCFRISG